jgi:hypothetical protein
MLGWCSPLDITAVMNHDTAGFFKRAPNRVRQVNRRNSSENAGKRAVGARTSAEPRNSVHIACLGPPCVGGAGKSGAPFTSNRLPPVGERQTLDF